MKKVVCLVLGFLMVMSLLSVVSVSGAEKVTLRMWSTASPLRDRVRKIIWRMFEEKHPGVKVDFEGIPWSAFNEKILTSAVAGTLPDVCRFCSAPRFASRGLLMPLEEFIEGPNGIDTDKYLEGVFPNPAITWEGKVYGLPTGWEGYPSFFYNRDIFKEGGVTPPKTWNELGAVAEKLTKKGPGGEVLRSGITFMLAGSLVDGFLGTSGALTTDVVGHEATKATFSAPGNVAGLNFLVNLVNDKYLRMSTQWDTMVKYFLEGKTAIYATVGSNAYQFRPQIHPEFNWGIMVPPVPEGKPQVIPAQSADCGFIFKTTKNPQLAWELLKAYCWREGSALVWTQKYGSVLPFNDVLDPETDNPYYYFYQVEPRLREMFEVALSGKSILSAIEAWHKNGAEIGALENGEYGLLFAGKKSVEEVVRTLDEKVTAMLTE